jgi:hypothetical protein
MSGILLLVIAFVWLVASFWLAKVLTTKLPLKWWRIPVGIACFVSLLVLPLADEIVGKIQFQELCAKNSTIQMNPATARGKTVYLADVEYTELMGPWVPVRKQSRRYVDVATGEAVVSYSTLRASGGWLSRSFTEGGVAILFRGFCEPGGRVDPVILLKEIGVTRVERHYIYLVLPRNRIVRATLLPLRKRVMRSHYSSIFNIV